MGPQSILFPLFVCAIIISVCVCGLGLYMVYRFRCISRKQFFCCRYRADISSGWIDGIAVYESECLSWYKNFGFGRKPHKTWSRRNMELGESTVYQGENDEKVVSIPVHADGHRFWLFMSQKDHYGMISWLEAAPPKASDIQKLYHG